MTRRLALPWLCMLALCSACAGDPATAPAFGLPSSAARATPAPVARPIGGRCTTDIHSAVAGPQSLVLDMTGSCLLSHLGLTKLVIHQECWYAGALAGTCDNVTTLTAANGDRLDGTWHSAVGENSSDGCNATFEGTGTYSGGTGRFAGATGTSFAKGTAACDPVTGAFTGEYTTTGTITY